MTEHRTWQAIARRVAVCAAVALTLASCGGVAGDYGVGSSGTTGTGVSGGSASTAGAAALAGRWSHVVYFDAEGASRSSETIYAFDGAGGFTRVVVATNLTDGVADAVTDAGAYTATATTVTLSYAAPRAGTSTFAYRVQPATGVSFAALFLDGTAYTLLAPGASR